jgi:predicted DNA binding CopG/RHH family protein
VKSVTLKLDEEIIEKVKTESAKSNISFGQYVNQVLRLNTLKITVEPDEKRRTGPKVKEG